ncbi:MAG: hypothetical protein CMI18_04575 [Opitutaceae bacterium]|nr:hypothetical protein [Opitutaceae bacterium]|tara:strand:- start:2523 stop:2765 length:243 start_codon:yes stop_codon:yes gene_type:complete
MFEELDIEFDESDFAFQLLLDLRIPVIGRDLKFSEDLNNWNWPSLNDYSVSFNEVTGLTSLQVESDLPRIFLPKLDLQMP